jgi:hypothetical protein
VIISVNCYIHNYSFILSMRPVRLKFDYLFNISCNLSVDGCHIFTNDYLKASEALNSSREAVKCTTTLSIPTGAPKKPTFIFLKDKDSRLKVNKLPFLCTLPS